ncbi:hypothetical protein GOZ89_21550 [Agrobacterium vitis]|uniref:Uncharacterized protein n=1 Tax=Agrobacterium vitis TaxID=373 RepID=A0A125P248_AGRVI|nr:hypothetical protein [Agrobacterium vitis]KAA3519830.1 hypothetical protein DXM22_02920 [Agrobacterium vitis]KAA3531956.1 hypothetical protein DXT89_00810 [Agrobacterium vitis]MCE6074844.1 hypothetical protein [Agrobacterium vitis]MCF1467412.1 hypothetical protein [Agrobacterium vitis]MCF1476013.1 hypothetical protein [Agrobacterium vitis]
MRIDSSLGNSQYQSRYIHGASSVEDVAVESATTPRSRSAGGNSTSTLLSASLANALWSLDSSKKTAGLKTSDSSAIDESKAASPIQQIEAHYLEYMDTDEE